MPVIFGHEVPAKTLWIGGGLIAAAVAVVVWLRARAASQAAAQAQPAPSPDQSGYGGGGGGMTVAAPTQAAADQYTAQMAQDQLAAQGAAFQYLSSLSQQQQAAQRLQQISPQQQLEAAQQANAAFFASNPLSAATPTGVIEQKWKQFLLNGQTIWEDVSGKNRAPITEQFAEQIGAQAKGEGPYYQSKGGGFFAPLINATSNVLKGLVGGVGQAEQSAAGAYFQQQGIPYAGTPSAPPNNPPANPAALPTAPASLPSGAIQMSGGLLQPAAVSHAAPHGYHEIGGVG